MVRHHIKLQPQRRGFTLIEILVVVGIILLLMTISVGALRSAIGTARQHQTEATIMKVNGLIQQRMDAFYRALERTNLQQAKDKMKRDWYNTYQFIPPDATIDVMVRKDIFKSRFPQNFLERNLFATPPTGVTVVSSNHKLVTQSAALLYWIVTNSEVYGVGPVDESEFSSNEVRDTDGDGLLEFVDGWGRPLRFYRWPDHLFRPGDGVSVPPGIFVSGGTVQLSPIDRNYVSAMWSGLPAPATAAGEFDPLVRDPDDPTGQLWRFLTASTPSTQMVTAVQNLYGTPSTYNAYLIVSAGPDGVLGLLEPSQELTMNPGSPVTFTGISYTAPPAGNIPGQGQFAALDTSLNGWASLTTSPINDNISNRKR